MPPKLFAWRRALPKDWATNAYYKTGQTDGLRQPLKSGYDAILCFPKSVWGYETFWRSLGPNRGYEIFWRFLGPNWGYETFYRFSWKRWHETFSESHNEGTKHFEFFASGV